MQPIQTFAPSLIAGVLRRQPPSPARTALAWQIAVGPAIARVTEVDLVGTTLHVRARDARWVTEIVRATDSVLLKMQHLLGPDQVRRISTQPDRPAAPGRP